MITTLDGKLNTISKVKMEENDCNIVVTEDFFNFNIQDGYFSYFTKVSSDDYSANYEYYDAWYNHSEGVYTLNAIFFTQYDVLSDILD